MKRFPLILGALWLLVLGGTAAAGVRPRNYGKWSILDLTRCRADARAALRVGAGFDSVEMFSLPDLKLKGVLTGQTEPTGMCSDSRGDVYVVNISYPYEAIEYSHGGDPIKTITGFVLPRGAAVSVAPK